MAKVPAALSVSQVIAVLEGFLGVKVSGPTILKWLKSGAFPHARKQTPAANSRWMIPVDDVTAYVRANYPTGPVTHEVDEEVRAAFEHIVSVAYPEG